MKKLIALMMVSLFVFSVFAYISEASLVSYRFVRSYTYSYQTLNVRVDVPIFPDHPPIPPEEKKDTKK